MSDSKKGSNVVKLFRALGTQTAALVSRSRLGALGGVTFDGNRRVYEKLGYKTTLGFNDYMARYRREGIARKVVTAFPSATWRNAPIIVTDNDNFVKAFQKLSERLSLRYYLERADSLSGIGKYGVLLIGASTGDLSQPLTEVGGEEDVLYLAVYTECNATVKTLVTDPTNPRFGLPEKYTITLTANVANVSSTLAKEVHYTRLLHIAELLEEDEIFSTPRMEPVWNYLDDTLKVIGGTAEAIWLTADRGIQFDVDKDAQLDENDLADFSDEIEEYMHGYRRFIRTQGITANVLGSEVPDPSGEFSSVMALIAGATGIPSRVLLGSERGQLASSQDEKNFNARVKERQENYAEPRILRPFIDRMIDIGALPKAEYTIEWPDPSTLTMKEKADVAARYAQGIKNIATQTKGGQIVITPDEFRKNFLNLEPLEKTDEDGGGNSSVEEGLTPPSEDEPQPEDEKNGTEKI